MKKKIFSLAFIMCLFAVTVGSTAAYFTASETATNVITTKNVNIDILETTVVTDKNGVTEEVPFGSVSFDQVMPTAVVSKIVRVQMPKDSAEAWVRVKIDKIVTLVDDTAGNEDYMLIDVKDDWIQGGDGWFYYTEPLNADELTDPIFEEVHFSYEMGNSHQKATAKIIITAQAVHTANNGSSVLEAAGWPEE